MGGTSTPCIGHPSARHVDVARTMMLEACDTRAQTA
jgi:hypothetical protein